MRQAKVINHRHDKSVRCKRCRGFGHYLYGYNDEERKCEDCNGTGLNPELTNEGLTEEEG